jgi:hypothetical protein
MSCSLRSSRNTQYEVGRSRMSMEPVHHWWRPLLYWDAVILVQQLGYPQASGNNREWCKRTHQDFYWGRTTRPDLLNGWGANKAAHLCAKQASLNRKRCMWINCNPGFLVDTLWSYWIPICWLIKLPSIVKKSVATRSLFTFQMHVCDAFYATLWKILQKIYLKILF